AGAENAPDADDEAAGDTKADAGESASTASGPSKPAPSKPAPGARPVRPTGTRRPTGKRNVGRR
ncbi:protein translocase subunit SecF, partial [Mycobacterium tuberculosis]|nr:protein translocase subunit SecF [Mycobacterium tuberculosis]